MAASNPRTEFTLNFYVNVIFICYCHSKMLKLDLLFYVFSCIRQLNCINNYDKKLFLFNHSMASLLSKFRIDYQSLKMVSGITEKPKTETINFFNKLLDGFREEGDADSGRT